MELSRLENTSLTIVPQPPPPGLYVTIGPEPLVSWALERLTQTLVFPARVVWVDAANAFNAYLVAAAARSSGKDPTRVLRSYLAARPFTAYQLEAMVSEKTLTAARRFGAILCVMADPLSLFAAAEERNGRTGSRPYGEALPPHSRGLQAPRECTQVRQCYARFLAGLKALASQTAVLVLAPLRHCPQSLAPGMTTYEAALLSAATRLTRLQFVNHKPILSLV